MQGTNGQWESGRSPIGGRFGKENGQSLHGYDDLKWMLSYELRAAGRYRRFVTVVLVGSAEGNMNMKKIPVEDIRGSDELFDLKADAAILMGETDGADALTAVDRLKSRCNHALDLRYGVASYPTDGREVQEIISAAQRRLNEAKAGGFGMVVSAD